MKCCICEIFIMKITHFSTQFSIALTTAPNTSLVVGVLCSADYSLLKIFLKMMPSASISEIYRNIKLTKQSILYITK